MYPAQGTPSRCTKRSTSRCTKPKVDVLGTVDMLQQTYVRSSVDVPSTVDALSSHCGSPRRSPSGGIQCVGDGIQHWGAKPHEGIPLLRTG